MRGEVTGIHVQARRKDRETIIGCAYEWGQMKPLFVDGQKSGVRQWATQNLIDLGSHSEFKVVVAIVCLNFYVVEKRSSIHQASSCHNICR